MMAHSERRSQQNNSNFDKSGRGSINLNDTYNTHHTNRSKSSDRQPSPRSTLSYNSKLIRQKNKLNELKQEAINRLEGLQDFSFMVWSKEKHGEESTD